MKKISTEKLPLLYAALNGDRQLWIPVQDGDRVEFGLWREGAAVSLAGKTLKSGKDFFFPQNEDFVSFQKEGKKITITEKKRPTDEFVVFGMRGCDLAGLEVLDLVFLAEPKDSFYEARRGAGIIVTLACGTPDESCFCTAFGVNPAEPKGDVAAWLVGDTLYWKPTSDKGEKLTAELGSLLEDAGADGDKAVAEQQAAIADILKQLPNTELQLPKVGDAEFDAWFESPNWAKMAESCLGCGTCTFVCPTCQCYDIQDRDTKDGIRRFRCWDSCMYSDFTLMAHGNIRNTQMQRFRQRFMHKLVYFPQNNDGTYSCVGCGRCVEKCPSSLNIVKVIKAMQAMEAMEGVGK